MLTRQRATVQDLYAVPENCKAEIVNGELLRISPTGFRPGRASGKIYASLVHHEDEHGGGFAVPDNVGFVVNLPNRTSFSPDAAWFIGEPGDMRFVSGAPAFAVEVRSEGDYGPGAEQAVAYKIADYFAAGTQVVWDVDLLSEDLVKCYRRDKPESPVIFRLGDIADAEPAVPGWRFDTGKLL